MVAPRAGAAPAAEGGRTARASAPGAALAAAAFASVAAFAVSPWLFCSLMLSVDTSVSGVGDSGCEEFNQEFDSTIPIASFGCQPVLETRLRPVQRHVDRPCLEQIDL
jgi:hypothetical protein